MSNSSSISVEHLMELETSLRNFFVKEKTRATTGSTTYMLMKYRGLSLKLKNIGSKNCSFIVGIAAYEAYFRVADGMKYQGSLGGDEKIVRNWYLNYGNKEKLEAFIGINAKIPTNMKELKTDNESD